MADEQSTTFRVELDVPDANAPGAAGRYEQQIRASLRAAVRGGGPPTLTFRIAMRVLALSGERAPDFLYGLATSFNAPVLIIGPAEGGPAPEANVQVVALAPQGWSQEKVMGYVGGLRAEFGESCPALHAGVMAYLPGQPLPLVKE